MKSRLHSIRSQNSEIYFQYFKTCQCEYTSFFTKYNGRFEENRDQNHYKFYGTSSEHYQIPQDSSATWGQVNNNKSFFKQKAIIRP